MHNDHRAPLLLGLLTALMMPVHVARAEPNWELVASDSDHSSSVFIDTAHMRTVTIGLGPQKKVRAWVRYVKNKTANGHRAGEAMMTFDEFDCVERQVQSLKVSFFDAQGNLTSSSGPLPGDYVAPGTLAEAALDRACELAGQVTKP